MCPPFFTLSDTCATVIRPRCLACCLAIANFCNKRVIPIANYYCRETAKFTSNGEKDVITFSYCRETAEITSNWRKDIIIIS